MSTQCRQRPNILVTGTPGTGKTTFCQMVVNGNTFMRHIDVSQLIKDAQLHDGWNTEFECYNLNEDKLCDELEEMMSCEEGGILIDFHTCDFFPERWFDQVIVLRSDSHILYDRLSQRGYNAKKINENMECEIMQVVLEEARESYRNEIILEWTSNTVQDIEENVLKVQRYHLDHPSKITSKSN